MLTFTCNQNVDDKNCFATKTVTKFTQ